MVPLKPINLIFIILLSSAMTNGIRRKSKIDLPIANAAEAPFDDNVAVASANDATKVDAPPAIAIAEKQQQQPSAAAVSMPSSTEMAAVAAASSSLPDNAAANGENDIADCDPDMIGFEIITG